MRNAGVLWDEMEIVESVEFIFNTYIISYLDKCTVIMFFMRIELKNENNNHIGIEW